MNIICCLKFINISENSLKAVIKRGIFGLFMRIYVDTNVYLDYFLDRKKSDPAFRLFTDVISCKHKIIISEQVLYELNKQIDYSESLLLFQILEPKTIIVNADKSDFKKAKKIDTHFSDALHIVLARKAGADVIITRNLNDFLLFFEAKRPEEL